MRRLVLLLTLVLHGWAATLAQEGKTSLSRKLSPGLTRAAGTPGETGVYWIVTTDLSRFKDLLASNKLAGIIRQEYPATRLLVVHTTRALLDSLLLPSPLVLFVDRPRLPREEAVLNTSDPGTNQVNIVHSQYPTLNGQGLTVSVKENKPDTTDIDLKGRYLTTPLSSPTITQHAGIMSTLIGGGGNSDLTGKGAAWGTRLSSSDFASLLPDANSAYQQYQVSVQNHSYGTGIENYYGADAAAYDASSLANPGLLHIFSAGNAGTQTSTQGAYAGIPGYANLTGSFKMGKNMIITGASNRLYQAEAAGSKGPAYDGRVKPELVAFGEDGSSGAAAITSGITLLVQQAYRQQAGQLPPAALVKAILLNTADDVAAPGIDFQTGYGSVNAFKAIQATLQQQYYQGSITQGQTHTTPFTIPAGISQARIMLCWFDVPAPANAPKALIQDIDLELVNTATGERWQPWVLSHFPHPDSLAKGAVRKRDSLNNNEKITLDHPPPGNYAITVKGYRLTAGPQAFAVSWQLDTAGRFQWYFPAKADHLAGGETNTLRWSSTMDNHPSAQLEYSTDGGNQWRLITASTSLDQGYYQWTAPDTFTRALLRLTTNQQTYLSDTFTISSRLKATTGFDCPDSFLLTWNKPAGVNQFIVYALGERYLSPLVATTDTNLVLSKAAHPGLQYTVAPVLGQGFTGQKAYTFDYTQQGVACYIRSFLADLADQAVSLHIGLGTRYGIQKLTVEKLGNTSYAALQSIEPVTTLDYLLTDNTLQRGANTYRLKLQLTDGSVIYSQPETVYHFLEAGYLVYPNPVRASSLLTVLSAEPGNSTFTLFNAIGQQVLHRPLLNLQEQIPLLTLQKGIYFYLIRKEGKKEQTGSVMVY